jgi:hypothetical protein
VTHRRIAIITAGAIVGALMASCAPADGPPAALSQPQAVAAYSLDRGYAPQVWTDPATGCEYLLVVGSGNSTAMSITPRQAFTPGDVKGCHP